MRIHLIAPYDLRLNSFVVKINTLPTKAGANKLINHIPAAVASMPSVFVLYIPNNKMLALPRIPKSSITAKLGTIAKIKKNMHNIQIVCHIAMSTSNICNNKIY